MALCYRCSESEAFGLCGRCAEAIYGAILPAGESPVVAAIPQTEERLRRRAEEAGVPLPPQPILGTPWQDLALAGAAIREGRPGEAIAALSLVFADLSEKQDIGIEEAAHRLRQRLAVTETAHARLPKVTARGPPSTALDKNSPQLISRREGGILALLKESGTAEGELLRNLLPRLQRYASRGRHALGWMEVIDLLENPRHRIDASERQILAKISASYSELYQAGFAAPRAAFESTDDWEAEALKRVPRHLQRQWLVLIPSSRKADELAERLGTLQRADFSGSDSAWRAYLASLAAMRNGQWEAAIGFCAAGIEQAQQRPTWDPVRARLAALARALFGTSGIAPGHNR